MQELPDAIPEVKEALIDERDKYLAEKIQNSPGNSVVAIIGAGHIPGIKKHLGQSIDLELLEEIPPPSKWKKVLAWGIPALIFAMFAYGFYAAGGETAKEMAWTWVIANSICAGLGALIALPHPLTFLTAVVIAPISSLNPFFAAGWAAGIMEALVRRPRVADLESIPTDMGTARGIWRNRVSKILLVMAFTNLGSMVGTGIGVAWMAKLMNVIG